MPNVVIFEIVALIVCLAVAVISLLMYLEEYRRRRLQQSASPFENLSASEEKSLGLIHRAMQRAQAIIGNAELAGIKVEATNTLTAKKVAEQNEAELSASWANLEKQLSAQMTKAYNEYASFLAGLKQQNEQIQVSNQEFIKARVNEIFDRFEQNLASFLTSTEQKSVMSIELELRSARQLVETYKGQQMAIIEENIISILERTLALILAKKIPLKDQVDLVYEALDKAKVEKFVI